MVSNSYERNIQHEHPTLKPGDVIKLKEVIHGLKLENETLKIRDIERGKILRDLPTLDNGGVFTKVICKEKIMDIPIQSTDSDQQQIPSVGRNNGRHG